MTVESGLGVECALVGYADLVDRIVVNLLCIFLLQQVASGKCVEWQSHEDTVEPYLIAVDGLVPIYFVGNGAWLFFQLLHHELHGEQILFLWLELVHTCYEMAGTYVVEVIVFHTKTSNCSVWGNHRVGIFAAVGENVIAAVFQICIKHGFQFDTHYITPFGFAGKIEQVGFGYTLHFRISEPLAVVFERFLLKRKRTVDEEIVEAHVACHAFDTVSIAYTVETAVLYIDVIYIAGSVECDNLHTVL